MTTRAEKIGVLQARAIDLGEAAGVAQGTRNSFLRLATAGLAFAFAAAVTAQIDPPNARIAQGVVALLLVGTLACTWRYVVWHVRYVALEERAYRARQAFYRGAS